MLITENENPNLISVDVDLMSGTESDVIEDFGNSSTPTDTERLFNFDLDCPPLGPEDEILQQISNGFEIPMLLDEDTSQTNSSGSGSGSDQGSLFLDTFIDPMYSMMDEFIDPLRVWENDGSNLAPFPECLIKEEVDMETSSASPAPSSESSDNWSQPPASESKFGLETPPISPPSQPSSSSSSSDNSPPTTPSPTSNSTILSPTSNGIPLGTSSNPIMVVSPINLMPINSNTKSDAPASSLVHMPFPSTSTTRSPIKRIKIIPKPETGLNSQQPPLNQQAQIPNPNTNDNTKSSASTRTIVLSPQDFAALTQQVKRNPVAAPTIKIQTVPPNPPAPNKSNVSKVSPITVIKTERLVSTPTPKVALAPPQTPLPLPATGSGRKQELEIKAIKRQQRMIKNRESACLSRKKKKEYVTSLENQITELHKENIQIKLENIALKERLKLYEENASWKRPSLQARKTTVVLVVLLVVSFNLGYSALWTNKNGLNWPERDSKVFSSRPSVVGSSSSQNTKSIASDASASSSDADAHITRALLWSPPSAEEDYDDSIANATQSLTCPVLINQTESIRLDSELRRWIGVDNKTTGISRQLLVPSSNTPSASSLFVPRLRKRPRLGRKKTSPSVNAIELYQSRSQYTQYAAFFDALHRRDDTFYVVSFSGDHLLLPALAHNKTLRPKMALVLPALPLNESMSSSSNDQITMMQIDCEVINTQMVQLKEVDVPEHLLRHRNSSTAPDRSPRSSTTKSPETRSGPSTKPTYPPRYRPYFVKDEAQVMQDPDQILYTDGARKYLDKKHP